MINSRRYRRTTPDTALPPRPSSRCFEILRIPSHEHQPMLHCHHHLQRIRQLLSPDPSRTGSKSAGTRVRLPLRIGIIQTGRQPIIGTARPIRTAGTPRCYHCYHSNGIGHAQPHRPQSRPGSGTKVEATCRCAFAQRRGRAPRDPAGGVVPNPPQEPCVHACADAGCRH